MSGGAIERVVTRVWGHGRRAAEDTTRHRAQLLELCMLVQHAAHVRGAKTDQLLCITPAPVDDFWRAVLGLVQDGPPSTDDGLYRWPGRRCCTPRRHAPPGRPGASWTWIWDRHAGQCPQ